MGDKVWYREMREGTDRRNKFSSEWKQGIWLGHSRNSFELIIGTEERVVGAFTVKRMNEDERWDRELIKRMEGTWQQPDPAKSGSAVPTRVSFGLLATMEPVPKEPLRKEVQVRRVYINLKMLQKIAKAAGSREQDAAKRDSEVCQERITTAIVGDEERREKIRRETERIARQVQAQVDEKWRRDKDKSNQPCHQLEIQGGQDDVEMGEASGAGVTDPAEGGEAEKGLMRHERGAREIEGREAQSNMSESNQRDEMEKVGETEMIHIFHKPPLRVTEAKKCGLRIGIAMDLTTGWDFRRSDHRQKAREYQKEYKPKLVIGSPKCVMFSQLQNLSPWSEEKQKMWVEAKDHKEVMCEIYAEQARCHRWFVHGHLAEATTWNLEVVRLILVEGVVVDQSSHGAKNGQVSLARRRTKVYD